MEIIRGKLPSAKKIVIYGPEGIGKSTLASQFPEPLFIDTEGSTKELDVARFPEPKSMGDVGKMIKYVLDTDDCCKTLVIDTADWLEALAIDYVCKDKGVNGIEDIGYGKGYVFLADQFRKLLPMLDLVVKKGINVVITAHAKMRKFEQPDEMGAYDRWEMKLSRQVAPMIKEWADMVLFANYETIVVKTGDDKYKAQGGKRVIHTSHSPCWDAKNRIGLPEKINMDVKEILK